MSERLKSEKIVVSAPLSFAGSAQRIWKITNADNVWLKWLLFMPIALMLIAGAWTFVMCWYFIMYVVFGILFIPFRLWRRGARKNKRNELRHRELLEAIRDGKTVK
jgi:Flp pilus assembly protein TadB